MYTAIRLPLWAAISPGRRNSGMRGCLAMRTVRYYHLLMFSLAVRNATSQGALDVFPRCTTCEKERDVPHKRPSLTATFYWFAKGGSREPNRVLCKIYPVGSRLVVWSFSRLVVSRQWSIVHPPPSSRPSNFATPNFATPNFAPPPHGKIPPSFSPFSPLYDCRWSPF